MSVSVDVAGDIAGNIYELQEIFMSLDSRSTAFLSKGVYRSMLTAFNNTISSGDILITACKCHNIKCRTICCLLNTWLNSSVARRGSEVEADP